MSRAAIAAICRLLLFAALAMAAWGAAAEMRLNVEEELRRAEEMRRDEQERALQSPMQIKVDPASNLGFIERGMRPPQHIAGAKYRVAVFTFEDPDATGLGNALSALLGREILMQSDVGSIGILRYEGSLAPTREQPLSYFDKIDLLIDAQDVTLAVWGLVRRTGDQLAIDVYAQIPPRVVDESFNWTLRLPQAMGGAKLVAHLRPSRMRVLHHEMKLADGRALAESVKRLDMLLAAPDDSATVIGRLPVGAVYTFTRRDGDWVEIATAASKGWVRGSQVCDAACTPLLDAGHFAAGLLSFIDTRRLPDTPSTLASDALAARTQLSVLEQLDTLRPGRFRVDVVQPVARWLETGSDPSRAPPGGAAFANIRAMAEVATGVQAAILPGDQPLLARFDAARADRSRVQQIAFELAQASVADPRNVDVLRNLAVLFDYAGQPDRASLAARLAAETAHER